MLVRLAGQNRRYFAQGVAALSLCVSTVPAVAEDRSFFSQFPIAMAVPSSEAWREVSGGVDAARDQWLVYSGMTLAPWSANLYADGWRLRLGGGYGQYGYDVTRSIPAPCGFPLPRCTGVATTVSSHYEVDHSYAEALLGYYMQLGRLTAKAFAGASMSSQRHTKADPFNTSDGTEFGAKAALELWLNVTEQYWTSLDVSYATARNESSARWRAGWRVWPQVSIGPELRYDKNVETRDGDWNGRAGVFTRYEWNGGEISLAGGITGRVDNYREFGDTSAYGTFNALFRY